MKKVLIIGFVLIISLGTVFAQGTKESADSEPTKLVLWMASAEDEALAQVHKFNEYHPNIEVELILAGSNELKTRLHSEWPKPTGDILSAAKETYDEFYDRFDGYVSKNIDLIDELLRDSADEPRYYGQTMPLQCFIVNTSKLSEDEYPRSWKDLIDPKYKGEIILANPALSGSAYAQIYMMYKLYGEDFLRKLAKNAVFVASSGAVPQSVARGEYSIGVTGETNVARYIDQGTPVTYVYPSEGTGARYDAVGIVKNGPNPKAARLWIDFVTSEESYRISHEIRNRRVILPNIPGPEHLPSLEKINLFDYDAIEAGEMRQELSEKFTDMI